MSEVKKLNYVKLEETINRAFIKAIASQNTSSKLNMIICILVFIATTVMFIVFSLYFIDFK